MVCCPIQLAHVEKIPEDLGIPKSPLSCPVLSSLNSCTGQHPESVILGGVAISKIRGELLLMRLFSPNHHATSAGIVTSNARTIRNVSKGIITGDGATSSGRDVGIIMESEHRVVSGEVVVKLEESGSCCKTSGRPLDP